MSWLETAAIVGDVVGTDALGAGASALGAGALSDAILPSALDSLGSEFGTTEAFNAAGFGPNSAMAANTTSGGIGAGAGVGAANPIGADMAANATTNGAATPGQMAIADNAAYANATAANATSGGVMDYFNSALDWMNGH